VSEAPVEMLPLLDAKGQEVGALRLGVVPGGTARIRRADAQCARVQLVEDGEYRYAWQGLEGPVRTSHPELFKPDDTSGHTGRLRPGRFTGTVQVCVFDADGAVGWVSFEVRSRKLHYESEYRWMLRDITERFAELVLQSFAASTHRFAPSGDRAAGSLYQRFAFLASVLGQDDVQDAMHRVLNRPKVAWVQEVESRSTARGIPPSSTMLRQVARAAHPVAWPQGRAFGVPALPRELAVHRTVSTVDSPPNRFVRFALESFRDVVHRLAGQLDGTGPTHLRGREEAAQLLALLDRWLGHPMLRRVGPLRRFPSGSTVLQNQSGYRTILRVFLLSDLAAKLSWDGAETVFKAGKRDVATLYEYWTYLELASVVGRLCGQAVDHAALVKTSKDGLRIGLRSGAHQVLRFSYPHPEGTLALRLHYNRSFSPAGAVDRSWTRLMRPDVSLEVVSPGRYDVHLGSTWLHFDAKYRVNGLADVFGPPSETSEPQRQAKRDDLLKMHAYRDAILRSAGAYVLFPGDAEPEALQRYSEVLPGLGAFSLRPTEEGPCAGRSELQRFLARVLKHLGSRTTARERDRYWRARAWTRPDRDPGLLSQPPADTLVGLGLLKSAAHREWTAEQRLYCVRADADRRGHVGVRSRFLQSELLVLYGADGVHDDGHLPALYRLGGSVTVLTRSELEARGYPSPGGEKYLAMELSEALPWADSGLDAARVDEAVGAAPAVGAPLVVRWLDLESVG